VCTSALSQRACLLLGQLCSVHVPLSAKRSTCMVGAHLVCVCGKVRASARIRVSACGCSTYLRCVRAMSTRVPGIEIIFLGRASLGVCDSYEWCVCLYVSVIAAAGSSWDSELCTVPAFSAIAPCMRMFVDGLQRRGGCFACCVAATVWTVLAPIVCSPRLWHRAAVRSVWCWLCLETQQHNLCISVVGGKCLGV
jgi:hypothetical protein